MELQASDLLRIQGVVNNIIKGDKIDREQLALDIWFEIWDKKIPNGYLTIKHRCIDKLRSLNDREEFFDEAFIDIDIFEEKNPFKESSRLKDIEHLDYLFNHTVLTSEERHIIFYSFYSGKTNQEIGDIYGMSKEGIRQKIIKVLEKLKVTFKVMKGN